MTSEAFEVSVIIPVFKAEKYLRESVESAVMLPEVGEVLLIEDRSPDGSLELCHLLENENDKVRVFTHPNRENRGPGISRNLGIREARSPFVSFLDADDWYLANRFHRAGEILSRDRSVDGVYDAAGFRDEGGSTVRISNPLITLSEEVAPEDLLVTLLEGTKGRFHTNAVTIRKEAIERVGLFDPALRLHEDTHLWLRLAHACRLVPGSLREPVAMRRVHADNTIQGANRDSRRLLDNRTWSWFEGQRDVNKRALRIIFNRFIAAQHPSLAGRVAGTLVHLLRHPSTIAKLF